MRYLKFFPKTLCVLLTVVLSIPFAYSVVQYVHINGVSATSPGDQQVSQTFPTNSEVNYTINNYDSGDDYTIAFNHEFQKKGLFWSHVATWDGQPENRDAPGTEPFTETKGYSVSGSFSEAGEYRFKANYNVYGVGGGAGSDTDSSSWTPSFDVN